MLSTLVGHASKPTLPVQNSTAVPIISNDTSMLITNDTVTSAPEGDVLKKKPWLVPTIVSIISLLLFIIMILALLSRITKYHYKPSLPKMVSN